MSRAMRSASQSHGVVRGPLVVGAELTGVEGCRCGPAVEGAAPHAGGEHRKTGQTGQELSGQTRAVPAVPS